MNKDELLDFIVEELADIAENSCDPHVNLMINQLTAKITAERNGGNSNN